MKLIRGLKIKKENDNYVFDFSNIGTPKKITSRVFPMLLGKNMYNSPGYAVLDRARMISFTDIDSWYKFRGELAEKLAYDYIKAYYKSVENVDVDLKSFNVEDFKGYDMFDMSYGSRGNETFGGVPDIAISKPREHRAIIEVKSKNISRYENIVVEKQIPEEELLQARLLGYLSRVDKVIMAYVFLTNEQEENIKSLLKENPGANVDDYIKDNNLTFKDFEIRIALRNVEREEMHILTRQAQNELEGLLNSGSIPKHKFNSFELGVLDEYIKKSEEEQDDIFETF